MTVLDVKPAVKAAGRASRDEDHYYHPLTGQKLVRVSTVLSQTTSTSGLNRWHGRKAAEYTIENIGLINALLREGRKDEIRELVGGAAARETELKADMGTHIHDCVETLILSQFGATLEIPDLPAHLRGTFYDGIPAEAISVVLQDGFLNFVADWRPELLVAEMPVFNPGLGVAGTLDIIMRLHGFRVSDDGLDLVPAPGESVLLVVDLKTGKEHRKWKQQQAAYRRMTECAPTPGDLRPMPPTDAAAIVHLRADIGYPRGYKLKVIGRDEEREAWNRFRRRKLIYDGDRADRDCAGRVAYPLRADGTQYPPLVADIRAEGGWGSMPAKLMTALGADLTFEDLAVFSYAELLTAAGIGPKTAGQAAAMLQSRGYRLADDAAHGKAA